MCTVAYACHPSTWKQMYRVAGCPNITPNKQKKDTGSQLCPQGTTEQQAGSCTLPSPHEFPICSLGCGLVPRVPEMTSANVAASVYLCCCHHSSWTAHSPLTPFPSVTRTERVIPSFPLKPPQYLFPTTDSTRCNFLQAYKIFLSPMPACTSLLMPACTSLS